MKRGRQFIVGIGALIIAGLAMSAASFAHPGFGPGRLGMMRRMGPPLLEQLQLSSDQRAQLDLIFASGRETIRPLAQQLREKAAALRETTRTGPFDEALVRSQAQDVADVQAQLMVARAQMMNQALTVLTDDQKARLTELRAERFQQFRELRKQRMGKSDQPQN
jgi:Spy/CpxP family protein refolding chaperone